MRIKLGDVCSEFIVPQRNKPTVFDGNIPWCRIEDITHKYLEKSSSNHCVSKETVKKMNLRIYPINTVLFSCSATIGTVAIVKKPLITNQTFIGLVCDDSKISYEWLYYYLMINKHNIANCGIGSTIKYISREQFENFEIDLPDRKTQDKIAEILSGIDEQINRNNEVVKKLQVLAQTIYSVTFEQYLNKITTFNTELKREIPVGWTARALKEFVTLTNGISYSEKDLTNGINMINLNSFNLDGSYKVDGIKKYGGKYKKENILKPYDLLISKTDVTRNRDIICRSILVPDYYNCDVVYSSDISKIECKDISKYYLNLLFNSNSFHNYIKQFANGTVVLHLMVSGMLEFKIPVPNDSTFCEFDYKVEPLFKQMNILVKENIELSKLKEKILPLLINGQLSI